MAYPGCPGKWALSRCSTTIDKTIEFVMSGNLSC